MKLLELTQPEIILVCGNLCSGKGTYCNTLKGYTHVATSDVVKQISGYSARSDLHKTADLDTQIADQLIDIIEHNKPIVVDGIRQMSIMQRIIDHFGEPNVKLVWLEVPLDTLKQRYQSRQHAKDDQDFDTAFNRDKTLGIGDVETFIKTQRNSSIVDHT